MLKFEDLSFLEIKNNNKYALRVTLYRFFYKEFGSESIVEEFGKYSVHDNKIIFEGVDKERAEKKFMQSFRKYKKDLTYSLNGNKAIFVDEDLELPLIGLNFLGIVDKGSQMIEIKPITNCNADCIFCSVNEGCSSKKSVDFVVDKDYLVFELKELLAFKEYDGMSVWLNPHGEPTLYSKLSELCDDILNDEHVKDISIITNGILMDKNVVDELRKVSDANKKKIKIALSVSGVDENKKIMGSNYPLDSVLKNMEYIASNLPMTITPVLLDGINDNDVKKIIEMSKSWSKKSMKSLGEDVNVIIQRFSANKRGRNPIKETTWDQFTEKMRDWEKETGVRLLLEWGKIMETKQLPLICKKGENLKVKIISVGRQGNERIGILETKNGIRAISLSGCLVDKGIVKSKIVQNKYNLYVGKC